MNKFIILLFGCSWLCGASAARADFVTPAAASNGPWQRPTTLAQATTSHTTFQQWDVFSTANQNEVNYPNVPGVGVNVDGPPLNPAGSATIAETTGVAFLTGGNIYSFSAPTSFRLETPNSNLGASASTKVLLQIRTRGSTPDFSSFTFNEVALTMLAGYSYAELFREEISGGFGGTTIDHKLEFIVPGSRALDTVRFSASASSMSLDRVSLDTIALASSPPIPGDFDRDGAVDQDDYALWRTQFGATVTPSSGADANGDGAVDAIDYTVWRDALGTPGAIVAAQAVPEPVSWGIAAGVLILGWRRKRRGNGARCYVKQRRQAFTLVELLVTIAIIGILVALLLPAVQMARETARGCTCRSHLRQLALAMQLHHDTHQALPAARLAPVAGSPTLVGPPASAFIAALPYLEETSLAAQYDDTRGPTDPTASSGHALSNAALTANSPAVLLCPTMDVPADVDRSGLGSYAVSTGSGACRYPMLSGGIPNPDSHNGAIIDPVRGKVKLGEISALDGTSKTFLLGELDYGLLNAAEKSAGSIRGGTTRWAQAYVGVTWASVAGVYNSDRLVTGFAEWETFRSDHPGGCWFAFCDGSVRWIASDVSAEELRMLANRQDGEILTLSSL